MKPTLKSYHLLKSQKQLQTQINQARKKKKKKTENSRDNKTKPRMKKGRQNIKHGKLDIRPSPKTIFELKMDDMQIYNLLISDATTNLNKLL